MPMGTGTWQVKVQTLSSEGGADAAVPGPSQNVHWNMENVRTFGQVIRFSLRTRTEVHMR